MISMENLWNQSEYETILDMWSMWIKLTSWQNFCPLSDGPQNWQWRYFSTFWDLPCSIMFTILTHCSSKLSYWLFRLMLMKDLIQQTQKVRHNPSRRHGRQDQPSANKTAFPLYITITGLSWKLYWHAVMKTGRGIRKTIFKKDCNSFTKNRRTCKDGHYMCKALSQYKHLLN
jgi:hypothetical protein